MMIIDDDMIMIWYGETFGFNKEKDFTIENNFQALMRIAIA